MTRAAVASVVMVVGMAGPAPAQRIVGYRVVAVAGRLPGPYFAPPPAWGWPPVYGYGYGFGYPFVAPPVVVSPPPVIVVNFNQPVEREREPAAPAPGPKLERLPKPNDPGPPPKFPPFAPPAELGPTEVPEADPAAEAARQVRLAREAFAAGAYGRAAERLAAASKATPDDPLPYLLTAQARFAGGRYADAVTAVREGMRRSPDWPAAAFRPRELYGPDPDRFGAHLTELRRAAAAHPGAASLRFLLAYQLWFGGDRAEAVRLFRAVAAEVRDPAEAERFIREAGKE